MQARQLRRARGSHRSFDRPRPYLPSTAPSYERPFLLRVSSTGPAYVWCGVVWCGAVLTCGDLPYLLCVVPGLTSTDPGEPTDPSTDPPMCSALLMCGDLPYLDRPRPMSGARPYCLCVVLCFAYLDRPRLCAVTGLSSYVRCLALLRQAPAYVQCPGCFALPGLALPHFDSPCFAYLRHPPGVLCFALLCLLCLLYVLTCLRVFYTY